MNISYNWLTQYVDLSAGSVDELCNKLTRAGIEVEAVKRNNAVPDNVVVAEIIERQPHPNADKLSVCRVFDGEKQLQIVCGAPNCDAGKKVPLAKIGATLVDAEIGKEWKIKKSKLRGELSQGMMCSAKELGFGADSTGLLELDTKLIPGTPLSKLFPGDATITVEVTPNRPDWLSHWGIARDVACLLHSPATFPEIKLSPPSPANTATQDLVVVEDLQRCPRYTARIIRGIKVGESPDWLKKRLQSVGLRPINNIVDITNFVLMELGQPLHAFDLDKLAGNRIVVCCAHSGEMLELLDDTKLKLREHDLVICDAEKPVCLAGVMGGVDTGVVEQTVNVLLESACFSPAGIRATSRELGISSDSSHRFERGIDWEMVTTASDRAAALILELAGGELGGELVDVKVEVSRPAPVTCTFDRVRNLLGITIDNSNIVDIFRRLQLDVNAIDDTRCVVTPPSFRPDIQREADLAEEVARIHGLDKVPSGPVTGTCIASIADDASLPHEQLNQRLVALGLYECMHYSLVSEKSALTDSRFTRDDVIRIANPLSLELACMRPSLFGEMLNTVERNIARRNFNLNLFELGTVFCANQELYPEEHTECCIMLSGRKKPERFSAELEEVYDFYDLKGLLESLMEQCKIASYRFAACEDSRFSSGNCAALIINRKTVGHFGPVAPQYTGSFRTEYPVIAAIFDADAVIKATRAPGHYRPVPLYPSTTRDIAFVADKGLEHQTVLDFVKSANPPFLEKVELFDIFSNDNVIGADRKSMAYSLTFRHPERTLTDEEINRAVDKLRGKIESQLNVELR